MNTPQMKQNAQDFLMSVVKGDIDQAYAQFVDMSGKHHNAYTPAGFEGLKQAMKDSDKESPNKQFNIQRVLLDGDLVAVHSQLIRESGDQIAVVHLFRFENDKIVEMWDVGMPLPADPINADGAF